MRFNISASYKMTTDQVWGQGVENVTYSVTTLKCDNKVIMLTFSGKHNYR
jgi:hypothetical protein